MLFTIHMMLSAMTKTPELALSEADAKALGKAIADVGRHYDVEANPVLMDWTALAMCAGGIYGPRIVALRIRKGAERRETEKAKPAPAAAPQPQPEARSPDLRFLDPTQPGFGQVG